MKKQKTRSGRAGFLKRHHLQKARCVARAEVDDFQPCARRVGETVRGAPAVPVSSSAEDPAARVGARARTRAAGSALQITTPDGVTLAGEQDGGEDAHAIVLLHEATLGAMRDLDRLAAAALRETARKKRKLVERDVVSRVIEADTRERDR